MIVVILKGKYFQRRMSIIISSVSTKAVALYDTAAFVFGEGGARVELLPLE